MLRNAILLLAILTALAGATGCSDSNDLVTGGNDGDVSDSTMADVSLASDLLTDQIFDSELAAMGAVAPSTSDTFGATGTTVREVEFSRTRSCPLGGEFHVEGMIVRTINHDTHTMNAVSEGTQSQTDCVFAHAEMTITVNGTAVWDIARRRVEGVPDGPQTSHYAGSFTALRSDGAERACEYVITVVRDPEARTRTLDGVICGTEVHRTVSWSHEE